MERKIIPFNIRSSKFVRLGGLTFLFCGALFILTTNFDGRKVHNIHRKTTTKEKLLSHQQKSRKEDIIKNGSSAGSKELLFLNTLKKTSDVEENIQVIN